MNVCLLLRCVSPRERDIELRIGSTNFPTEQVFSVLCDLKLDDRLNELIDLVFNVNLLAITSFSTLNGRISLKL